MRQYIFPFLFLVLNIPQVVFAQPVTTRSASSAEIQLKLGQLNEFGSVLYIAAHPDDENTRLISWLALSKGYKTAYMSLTRGDGGQNLIGSEQGIDLGLIRTQELLAARHIDGGKQYFSSAYDFGFSKNPEETFSIWNREKVLSEVVWVIRSLKPDVIITRFSPEPGNTHGHHTASAQLALEAFSAAADPQRFPEQLREVDVWQAKRIFWNTSWFFYGTKEYDKTGLLPIETGDYIPQLGQSVGERAAESRSQHRSQGFGSARQRGEEIEYLKLLAGATAEEDILEGVVHDWTRLKGAEKAAQLIAQVNANYLVAQPQKSIPGLLEARKELKKLSPSFWRDSKLKDIENLVVQCAGLFAEALLPSKTLIQGDSLLVKMEVIARQPVNIQVKRAFINEQDFVINETLKTNKLTMHECRLKLDAQFPLSQAFWLVQEKEKGMFRSGAPAISTQGYNAPSLLASVELLFENETDPVVFSVPVLYKFTEPDRGEIHHYPEVVPAISVSATESVCIIKKGETKTVRFKITSHDAKKKVGFVYFNVSGDLRLKKNVLPIEIEGENAEEYVDITILSGSGIIYPRVEWDNKISDKAFYRISYPHIPNLIRQPVCTQEVVEVEAITHPLRIGYLAGAGDEMPAILRGLGYTVELIEDNDIQAEVLKKRFDVVIAGIRAYNTRDILATKNQELMNYVQQGGKYIVQYNTTGSLVNTNIGPYPFKITRNRITVEEAPLALLDPKHPVFNNPNKIGEADFTGWIQERGLYFVEDLDTNYTKLLSGNDPNEKTQDGILLYTNYGKGKFIYTGLSFFRQFPAGRKGAIRLFINLIEN